MKIDLNITLKDLDGNPIAAHSLNKIIAQNFAQKRTEDYDKYANWSKDLWATGTIEATNEEVEEIIAELESLNFGALYKQQVMEVVAELKSI